MPCSLERVHLYELARPVPARRKRVTRAEVAVPGALALLASMPSVPALLLGRRNDVLAWNRLGHALVAGHLAFTDPDDPATRPNQMRLLFLDPHTREMHRDWADEAASAVASLRFVAGQYPDDRALAELVGELSMNSREFARLWAKHDVRLCSSGTKRLHHPQVGDLDFALRGAAPARQQRSAAAHTHCCGGECRGGCAGVAEVKARCWANGCHALRGQFGAKSQ